MPDLEKVIRGLELCVATVKDCDPCPTECPYYGKCMGNNGLFFDLMKDALTLLKAQEPVLLENQHKPYGHFTNANSPWISRCPKCGKKIEGKQTRFCKYCGKAVKWDA